VPESPAQKSSLASILDQLPKVIEKFSALEDRANKVVTDVGGLTRDLKENPSQLIWGSKDKNKSKDQGKEKEKSAVPRERSTGQ
jgi:conjugal transfer/entry exclusion protein